MTHLSKLSLSNASHRQPMTPVARKRLNLLRKLDLQIQAAQAQLNDKEFLEVVVATSHGGMDDHTAGWIKGTAIDQRQTIHRSGRNFQLG